MGRPIYVVEWRRYYSEYDFSFMSFVKEEAIRVMEKQEKENPDCDFKVETYYLDKEYEVWD